MPKSKRLLKCVSLPLGETWCFLYGDFPIAEDKWDEMLAILEAMKPGLVYAKGAEK